MKTNNALVYIKGLTPVEAQSDLKKVKRYCSENNLEIVEILFDETRNSEKDYDCLETLYNSMKSQKATTIIFNSCYAFYNIAAFINLVSHLIGIDVIRFHNGEIQEMLSKSKMKDIQVINQSMFDEALTVDFGNWVGNLSKSRKDVLFIDREENTRMEEREKQKTQKAIKNYRKDKGILGVVFDESNLEQMTIDVQSEMFLDKTEFSRVVVYEGFYEFEELLQSNKYYRVICDDLVNGNIDDLRDFIIACNNYSVEARFWDEDLSTFNEYPLQTFLDAVTGNL
ncbi:MULTISPECIES: hypothetical protein [Niallia]|uniref:Uncharacterized protein n=1 Tax=Niallia hominis TaxID=3133173 RepID=A0ABV1EYF1_9BACI|nr:hypothetical protein [Niallia circulans]MCF2650062.1 hypothetical protein [Niallia circulans]